MCRGKQIICCAAMVFCLFGLCACEKESQDMVSLEEITDTQETVEGEAVSEAEEKDSGQADSIFVYVCGQVKQPGVYELDAGSRIFEAVEAAGGMLEAAALDAVNQAAIVEDGQQIYIPSMEEAASGGETGFDGSGAMASASDGRVDINTADKEELMTLTGIGEKRAEAIIEYRTQNGPFADVEALMQVAGIKQATFDKIKDQIKVS